jgi:hypothetical protein
MVEVTQSKCGESDEVESIMVLDSARCFHEIESC